MDNDLLVLAKKQERLGLQRNEDILSRTLALEVPLNYTYDARRPNARDHDHRTDLIRIFNDIAKEIYGNHDDCPVVNEFGSFLMGIFDAKSDLDLSINFRDKEAESRRDVKITTLRKFATKFRALRKKGLVDNIQSILTARVPVLKVTDLGTGIECDLSVGNLDGINKSHLILIISAIDERFQKLCFLMKAWAKAHGINSSKDGTLNSLSVILLVAFHFQTRYPPIFPPFSAIFKGGTSPNAVKKIIPKFLNYGKENKESLSQLFVSLLILLESVENLWSKGLCVSVLKGSWIFKQWSTNKCEKIAGISIEDFTDRSQNTARAVKLSKVNKIYSSIHHSLQLIRSFIKGDIDAVMLRNILFSSDQLVRVDRTTVLADRSTHKNNNKKNKNTVVENQTKKKRKRKNKGKNSETPNSEWESGARMVDVSQQITNVNQSAAVTILNLLNQVRPTTGDPVNPTRVEYRAFNQGCSGYHPHQYVQNPHIPPPYHAQQHFLHPPHPPPRFSHPPPSTHFLHPPQLTHFSHPPPSTRISHPRSSAHFSHHYNPTDPHQPSHHAFEYSRRADDTWPHDYR